MIQGIDQGKGQFFFFDVVAGGLAYILAAIIEQVIFDLEGHAYFLTK
jgi:hypothetical protein